MIKLGFIFPSEVLFDDFMQHLNFNFAKISGFYIPNFKKQHDSRLYPNPNLLIDQSDALVFIGEHSNYHCLIINAIKNSKHVFIEKTEIFDSFELANFIKLSSEANVYLSAGTHWIDNINIASGLHYITSPSLIEFKHSCGYSVESNSFDFYRRKLYHALFFSLFTIRSNPKKIYSLGISTFTKTIDFINCSVEFDNGSILRIQIGAIDPDTFIRCRIHQKHAIASFDFQELNSRINFLNVFRDIDHQIFNKIEHEKVSLLNKSLVSFVENLATQQISGKSIEIAFDTALLSEQILDKLKIRSEVKQLFAME